MGHGIDGTKLKVRIKTEFSSRKTGGYRRKWNGSSKLNGEDQNSKINRIKNGKKRRKDRQRNSKDERRQRQGWTFCASDAQTRKVSTKSTQPETIKEKCWGNSAPCNQEEYGLEMGESEIQGNANGIGGWSRVLMKAKSNRSLRHKIPVRTEETKHRRMTE